MTDAEVLAQLAEAYTHWTFTCERGVWRADGPVVLTSSELSGLLLLLAVADPAATAEWNRSRSR
ncbi:hypothetical protein SMC26_29605 [Actinomadura fulvescens]|uniref:Uncharacterized protein n=1 Tax=Actinomadura fulvescens TaxID=46160 RepID=A0ABP6CZE3_9ACTN